MKKNPIAVIALLILPLLSIAESVVIKDPGYFKDPIRDGHKLFPDSLVLAKDAEQITIPELGEIGRLGEMGFTNLKKVTFGNIDYIPGGLFMGNNTIEEILFDGMLGHFDCSLVSGCPNLRKITFRGPISSTGGPGFAYDCPLLDSVVFESVVVNFGLGNLSPESKCPKFKGYISNGAFLNISEDSVATVATAEELQANHRLITDLERLADWQSEVLTAKNPGWMRYATYQSARTLQPVLEKLHDPKAAKLKEAMAYAWGLGDDVKTKLEILKEAASYAEEPAFNVPFKYAAHDDSMLVAARLRFNLDSIAGSGDDVSQIKKLMYWVHNNIEHNGSNGLAPGLRTLANNYDCAHRDSCGYNCRALAICLTEALLAKGIPARYVFGYVKRGKSDISIYNEYQ